MSTEMTTEALIVLFLIITITIGMISREINKRLSIPYSKINYILAPLLIIFGISL